ncbi:hypothetical protein R1flu_015048 [Riccia fluitans]|uniref:Uncharacterized protein n=1 Tax=Riccia fluitans TaxID=41844 RepID=A0ABD1YHY7_9MARC
MSGLNGSIVGHAAPKRGGKDSGSLQEKSKSQCFDEKGYSEMPKFVLGLTIKEKGDDFMKMMGKKLPQRPTTRSKIAEKNVNFISPGAGLCTLTKERYEVKEKKPMNKKLGGLKAMVDSDSE